MDELSQILQAKYYPNSNFLEAPYGRVGKAFCKGEQFYEQVYDGELGMEGKFEL